MSLLPALFNMAHRRAFERRALSHFADHDVVHAWAARDMHDRLNDITRVFSSVLLCGPHAGRFFQERFPDAVILPDVSPEGLVPFAGQFDVIIVLGELHHANDLPGVLIQLRRALKPDGVMMAACAGGETLHELRTALLQAEIAVLGGASPRVLPFADTQQMAGLLQRAGFALPVVDSEILTLSYRDMFHLMDDVRGMGESNCLAGRYGRFTPAAVFESAARFYAATYAEEGGRVSASFEIIFLIGWAPHESQQKPAKRGSGQVSLTEIL